MIKNKDKNFVFGLIVFANHHIFGVVCAVERLVIYRDTSI